MHDLALPLPAPLGLSRVRWTADKLELAFPGLDDLTFAADFLCDQAPARRDAHSGQHLGGACEGPDTIEIASLELAEARLTIGFAHGQMVTWPLCDLIDIHAQFPLSFLPASIPWDRPTPLQAHDVTACLTSDQKLQEMLTSVVRDGVAWLRGGAASPGVIETLVRRFAPIRETNYGRVFDVRSVAQADNLAYTALELEPHTDNPYRDPAPGLQILYCIEAAPEGGQTVLVDGFAAAEDLRAHDPQAFALLARTPVVFAWADGENRLRACQPLITCDADAKIVAIRFNHRSLKGLSPADPRRAAWRAAYRQLAARINDPANALRLQLAPGEAIILDNWRILHGRTAYDPRSPRWLQGAYADRDALYARLASLRHKHISAHLARVEQHLTSLQAQEPYGEELSIAQHMLQCARLASDDGASEELQAAALLHDVGWFGSPAWAMPTGAAAMPAHEEIGADRVLEGFGERVAAPIRLHVAAKRYLVARKPDYHATLSEASQHTLRQQGGPMNQAECAAFEASPGAADALRLRQYDDLAKDQHAPALAFAPWRGMLMRVALAALDQQGGRT